MRKYLPSRIKDYCPLYPWTWWIHFTHFYLYGTVRRIFNLKKLNSFIKNSHFKLDKIRTVLGLATPNCSMTSLDLKDAYYSVRIHPYFQKYVKFMYNGRFFKYTVFPNCLSICPRKFTLMLKPPFSHLRLMNYIVCGYTDDLCLQGSSYQRCAINVRDSIFKCAIFKCNPPWRIGVYSTGENDFLGIHYWFCKNDCHTHWR